MNKIRYTALVLLLVLTVGLFAGCGESTSAALSQAGNWYTASGRKLELKADGTFLLEGEAEGGVWRQTSEGVLKITDGKGTFDATVTEGETKTLTFGPYGTFTAENEALLQTLSSISRMPLVSVGAFVEGYAAVSWERDGVTESGLIDRSGNLVCKLPVTGTAFSLKAIHNGTALLELSLESYRLVEISSGKVLATSGTDYDRCYGYTDAGLAVQKADPATRETLYGCIGWDGKLVGEWFRPAERSARLNNNASTQGWMILDYSNYDGQASTVVKRITYLYNIDSGKVFRLEDGDAIYYTTLPDGSVYCKGPLRFADGADKEATEVTYANFRIFPDGTLKEETELGNVTATAGNFAVTPGEKTVLTDVTTKEKITLDLPTYAQNISFYGDYGFVSYVHTGGTPYGSIIDKTGKVLSDPIRLEYDADHEIRATFTESGYLVLKDIFDSSWTVICTPTGEVVMHGAKYPRVQVADKDLFCYNDTYIDRDGRVLMDRVAVSAGQ